MGSRSYMRSVVDLNVVLGRMAIKQSIPPARANLKKLESATKCTKGQVAGCCERGNGPSGSIKCGEIS
jgi:hypothetical protein